MNPDIIYVPEIISPNLGKVLFLKSGIILVLFISSPLKGIVGFSMGR